ncbi:MAG: response regulator [Proteiniphilum sp.]|nr:response regulator [Proteiniphilum sp.]
MNRNFLVVDDNLTVCLMLKSWLIKRGFNAETATDVNVAKQMVREQPFDLILADIKMPDIDGFTFLSWVKKYDSDILVIIMTGYADIESAVAAMKSGASDYIAKPIDPEYFFRKIDEAFKIQQHKQLNDRSCNELIKPPGKEYDELLKYLDSTVEHKTHLLITGNRGTGKSSAVKYLHDKGFHLGKPLVIMDMDHSTGDREESRRQTGSAGDESLLIEKLREARGGILHIRNAEQLDLNLQDELLGILTRQKRDDDFTQVVVSSLKKKEELQKLMIPKLYSLLEKNSMELPTLKGKKEVIAALTAHFLAFSNYILNKEIQGIDPELMDQFYHYAWPGNMQELKNMIIKAVLLTETPCISVGIATELFGKGEVKKEQKPLLIHSLYKLRKENYEKEKILEALQLAKGNKTMAASILNIDRKTLYNKIKLYNVST